MHGNTRYLALGLGLLLSLAHAGPVRDWLIERKAQRLGAQESAQAGDTPFDLPVGVRVRRNLAYGDYPSERFDVYLPAKPDNAPLIVMVHGGAWRAGDKAARGVVQNKVARWVPRGAVLVSLNYPLLPEADPLRQAQAVARGIAAVQGRAAEWGANPAGLVLMGHSAGAHLVALLSASPSIAEAIGAKPWLGSVVLDTSALDVVGLMQGKHYSFHTDAFGRAPAYWQTTSPLHQLSAKSLPMLVTCSSKRLEAPCGPAKKFAERAASLGVRILVQTEALDHTQMNEQVGLAGAYTEAIESFMQELDPVFGRVAGR